MQSAPFKCIKNCQSFRFPKKQNKKPFVEFLMSMLERSYKQELSTGQKTVTGAVSALLKAA